MTDVKTVVSAPLGVAGEYPSHDNKLGKGGFHIVPDENTRDALWDALRDETMLVHVLSNADGDSETYKWNEGTKRWERHELGTQDIPTEGLTFVMPDGSTTTGVQVLGLQGLKLEGSPQDGFNLVVDAANVQFATGPFLEYQDDRKGGKVLSIKPGTFERHKGEARLAYFDSDEVILGGVVTDKRKGALWANKVAYGLNNIDITADRPAKAVHLQDPYDDDPSVTGGTAMLCMLYLNFYGSAPDDGTIEVYRVNGMTGDVLLNDAGQPMGFIHHYKQGDKITPITVAQVYMAKGIVNAQWIVKHTFTDDPIKMKDWDVGNSCMLDMYIDKESINPALNEMQMILEKAVSVQKRYYGEDFMSNAWEYSFDIPESEMDVNQGQDSVLGIDFENPTKLKVSASGSVLSISNNDADDMVYFNTGIELTEEDTVNLRGKEVLVSLDATTPDTALELHMFVYTGNMADVSRPIVTGCSNMQPTLSAGWKSAGYKQLSEYIDGSFNQLESNFTIPNDARLVMFGVIPIEEQSPMHISLKPMTIDVSEPFTAHEVSLPVSQEVIPWGSATDTFVTHGAKFWKLGTSETNLPFGEVVQGKPGGVSELYVEEDSANQYKGGIKLTHVTEYTIEVWLNVQNKYKTDIPSREELLFHVKAGFDTISTSPMLVLKKGDFAQHVVHWKFDYDNKAAGTVLKLFGSAPVDGSAFIVEGGYHAAGVKVTGKVVP